MACRLASHSPPSGSGFVRARAGAPSPRRSKGVAISHDRANLPPMDARTSKSELTRAAILGAALDLAAEEGLESLTLQAVADRIGLSKSGVFSRVGSREALQKAVVEEFGRRYLADVFVPAMAFPKGLP